ncbi:hypothetical protein DCC39_10300 [Pueribacillus theae]|uniref:Uncharacterized protein n=1 Tax=Pueribacillus theae TaxID=2171751 RepID=A0A2U1K0P4_9BACI|nr:hypothetical protein [Pueribacillus theae]PWA11080.1 hypothetical protein DCC39_10300 [Pueribacillus theae]
MSLAALRDRIQGARYPTVMRPSPKPTSRLDTLKSLSNQARTKKITPKKTATTVKSAPKSSTSGAPNTLPLSSVSPPITYTPMVPKFRDIPTFDASYFMPNDTLKLINKLMNAKPNMNEKQLQERAKTQTELLTNPQIEALRSQINAFKSLIPQARKDIDSSYRDSQEQMVDSVNRTVREAIQEAQSQQGGIRSGVAVKLASQARQQAAPLTKAMHTDYVNTREQVLGALQMQQKEAQNLLKSIEKNKKNMTKENYNALKDQAVQQFRAAQQAQQQFLQGISQMESGARSNAARFQQESAAAYNQYQSQSTENYNRFMEQLFQQNMQQAQIDEANLAQSNLSQWTNYLTGPSVENRSDALSLLQQNRGTIIDAIGQEGYNQLENYIKDLGPNWKNPNYSAPYITTPASVVPKGFYDKVGKTKTPTIGNIASNVAWNLIRTIPFALNPGSLASAAMRNIRR